MSSQPQSRAEAHATSTASTVRYSRRVVTRALQAGHQGKSNAIHGSELAEYVPVEETTVRDIIAELRDDPHGPPIGQSGQGYYVLDSREELDEWVAGVKEEIATKRERLRANVESFNRRQL